MKPRTDFEAMHANKLLVKRATEGLEPAEADELAALGAESDRTVDDTAALVDLATLHYEPMPASLVDKVLAAALPAASTTAPAVPVVSLRTDHLPAVTLPPSTKDRPRPARRRTQTLFVAGWAMALVAAAAAIYLGVARPGGSAPRPASATRSEIDATTDVRTWEWDGSHAGVRGTIVWSRGQQRGYATLVGLPMNDPTSARYQLWIVDGARDERYPVDGGLFDVRGERTTIDFAPHVRVEQAVRFFVTREQPAGVVVSDRSQLAATTK